MDRRLRFVIVDELRRVTTALYDVIIPQGILAENEQGNSTDQEQEHHQEGQEEISTQAGAAGQQDQYSIYSVAEVIKWNMTLGQIKEIHYYGGGMDSDQLNA
jgi:hypothetical protein